MTDDEFLTAWKLLFGYNSVNHVEALKFKHDCGFGSERSYLMDLCSIGRLVRNNQSDTWRLKKENSNET